MAFVACRCTGRHCIDIIPDVVLLVLPQCLALAAPSGFLVTTHVLSRVFFATSETGTT